MTSRPRWPAAFARCGSVLLALALAAGCGTTATPSRPAAAVQPGDTCAVCGMELSQSPGPRAQAWASDRARPLIFDSTRDFFAFVLQPENRSRLQGLYVQDAARIDWQHPGRDADTFIDARRAVYVAWQPLAGSMGPTFAPFGSRADAETFARAHGGAILAFDGITPELVATLGFRCPATRAGSGSQDDPRCLSPRATPASPVVATASNSPGATALPASSAD